MRKGVFDGLVYSNGSGKRPIEENERIGMEQDQGEKAVVATRKRKRLNADAGEGDGKEKVPS